MLGLAYHFVFFEAIALKYLMKDSHTISVQYEEVFTILVTITVPWLNNIHFHDNIILPYPILDSEPWMIIWTSKTQAVKLEVSNHVNRVNFY